METPSIIFDVMNQISRGEISPNKEVSLDGAKGDFRLNIDGVYETLDLATIVKLRLEIDEILNKRTFINHIIMLYHENSPVKVWDEIIKDKVYNEYRVEINLEPFMEDDSKKKEVYPGYVALDNCHLSELVLGSMEDSGKNIDNLEIDSRRECAVFYTKNKKSAKSLVSFIKKNYVNPTIKSMMKEIGAKDVLFEEDRFKFVY